MITGELKNKIDGLWDIFAAGGLVNPLDVIEQITYLMFIHDLDDSDNLRAKEAAMLGLPYTSIFTDEVQVGERTIDGQQLKWSVFHDFPAGKMYSVVQEWVFPFIKNLHGDKNSAYSKYMDDAIFKLPTPLLLSKVVDALDEIYRLMSESQAVDVRGDTYEYLLSKISQSGLNGQFRTPRHIIRMMVELMRPTLNDTICDPAMGSAGFIMEAAKFITEHQSDDLLNIGEGDRFRKEIFHGSDSDASMLRIGCMNMMLHDVDEPNLYSLSDENNDTNRYTLCLANPPFAGSLDTDDIAHTLKAAVKTKKTELLFLALMMRMLQSGGRCASIVPDTVLTGDAQAYKTIRSALVDKHCMQAVITMPSGVFQPYSGVSTAIIIFTKTGTGGTDKVWFYDMRADGFSLTTQRTPQPEQNDIPDIISRFHNLEAETDRSRKEQSFFVTADEIRANGYDLSYKRYHEVEREVIEYEAPETIIARIEERQKAIDAAFKEFKKLLNS